MDKWWHSWKNTRLVAPGALAHHLQRLTDCKIQNGRQGAPKLPTDYWALGTTFAKEVSWFEHSFYEKRAQRRRNTEKEAQKKRKKMMEIVATTIVASRPANGNRLHCGPLVPILVSSYNPPRWLSNRNLECTSWVMSQPIINHNTRYIILICQ